MSRISLDKSKALPERGVWFRNPHSTPCPLADNCINAGMVFQNINGRNYSDYLERALIRFFI